MQESHHHIAEFRRRRDRQFLHRRAEAKRGCDRDQSYKNSKRAAKSTYYAVLWVLREYGVTRLGHAWMRPRLAEFSTEQIKDLIAAMERMRPRYSRTITDELISTLKEFYDVATQ